MQIQVSIQQHKEIIEQELQLFFEKTLDQNKTRDTAIHTLLQECRNFMLGGGKRLRSYITSLSYNGLGGKKSQKQALLSLELLHGYLLVHDDIMDKDEKRYNKPTIWKKYETDYQETISDENERLDTSVSLAILAGNTLNTLALQSILCATCSAVKKNRLVELYTHYQQETAFGQILDVCSSIQYYKTEQILEYYRLKTAVYSILLPLHFGAVLADKETPALVEQLTAFAEPLGIAFQLRDDLIGAFGNSSETGKSTSTDILRKKRTYLLAKALELMNSDKRKNFLQLWQQPNLEPKDIETIKGEISSSGAVDFIQNKINTLNNEAQQALTTLPFQAKEKNLFSQLINHLATRTK
ncbi:MAG: polyprenyl synthetase family protein [bacterium]